MSAATGTRYDAIGVGYAGRRREDPRLAAVIEQALGDARTVVNVGAGAGSYEPRGRHVVAVEPSRVMAAQRGPERPPAVRATADALPLHDASADAALAVLTVHHWDAGQERGVRELRRVATGPVVIVTFDAEVSARMWLAADYLPEVAELDRRIFPSTATLREWLPDDELEVRELPVAADTPDWTLAAFWAHPERVLDPAARASTSGFARMDEATVTRAVDRLATDLRSGAWDERHGHLRGLAEYDAGMRLVVARPRG